jgi:L-arabinokinase
LKSVVYYISGHGYGHAVRSCQVIQSLKKACPELEFHIRTTAPQWLFRPLSFPFCYYSHRIDVGILQKDSLDMRIQETLSACQRLHDKVPRLIEEEIAFIKKKDIRLVIGDIPPLCFEIAAQLSLPSVAITNFTWAWIYRAYLPRFPSFLPLILEMENFYRKATLALFLPFSCDLEIFPNRRSIPLIARVSALDKIEARKRLALPASAKIVLVSFGGFGLERLPWERLKRLREFFFVTTTAVSKKEKNFLVLPEAQGHYEDLVRAADVVVSKPGYGIVADVIAHRVPILYTPRGDFPEYPFLAEALNQWATCEFIPQEKLLTGEIGPYLRRLMRKQQNWPDIPLNGTQVAAERILELL